jgi:hypothetical protein
MKCCAIISLSIFTIIIRGPRIRQGRRLWPKLQRWLGGRYLVNMGGSRPVATPSPVQSAVSRATLPTRNARGDIYARIEKVYHSGLSLA